MIWNDLDPIRYFLFILLSDQPGWGPLCPLATPVTSTYVGDQSLCVNNILRHALISLLC